jgi:multicomponent K+:H+ antiporter subunit D
MFLVADLVSRQRGEKAGALVQGPMLLQPLLLGALFFVGAIALAGLPPFSGFLGKLMLLQALQPGYQAMLLWPVVLLGGLLTLVALSRAGSTLFWRTGLVVLGSAERDNVRTLAAAGLLSGVLLLVLFAAPVLNYVHATTAQLLDLAPYMQLVKTGETP